MNVLLRLRMPNSIRVLGVAVSSDLAPSPEKGALLVGGWVV